jgi:hypothetical protein
MCIHILILLPILLHDVAITSTEVKRSARPSTAGRRPPRVKDGVTSAPESAPVPPVIAEVKAAGILIEGQEVSSGTARQTMYDDSCHGTK